MATPRIFLSSTCYDLQEIRFQLRGFIEEMGYDPVMTEFGDIFYDLNAHVHDACKEEISRSNIFVLIIGNNYGSLYHQQVDKSTLPDSVTLQEFRKALEVGIPKYIFLNRFVQHDFENYRRTLTKHMSRHFAEQKVEDTDIERTRLQVKERFDATYPFPQDAYRYIFYFLDIIYTLDINNALYPFESFDNIKNTLKKQWAGFFYDALTKERTVAIEKVELLGKRFDKIENYVRQIAESGSISQDKKKLIFDIKKLASEFDIADLEGIQEKIHGAILEIMYGDYDNPRFKLRAKFDAKNAFDWMAHLNTLIQNYKWSQYIPITEIMNHMKYVYWKDRVEVPYKALFQLCGIFNALAPNDKEAFLNTISLELNKFYEPEPEPTDLEPF
jgi:hypothetical protein